MVDIQATIPLNDEMVYQLWATKLPSTGTPNECPLSGNLDTHVLKKTLVV